ncbi:MAG: signal recognition particle-docking protein FtsY [Clostridiales bacterium GWE2_32_10]|nr:MAG: signal recognition particle-docking protein FtsY [Clostridiales bacterium GWE2_32_10]
MIEDATPEKIENKLYTVEEKQGFFQKLVKGLSKTKSNIIGNIDNLLKGFTKIDEELFEELEEQLIMADIGVSATTAIIADMRQKAKDGRLKEPSQIKSLLKEEIIKILNTSNKEKILDDNQKKVILIIGVNGVGKTTTVGKLASKYRRGGKKVLLAAADTFRAAAIEQLTEWANRANIDIVKHSEGADPGAVVFDAIAAAKARKIDLLICDTAGRLHNKKNLMDELRKIYKIIEKEYPEAIKEMLLVLDATTGQNSLQQAKLFGEIIDIDGLILTKIDGTAKGGIVVAINKELNIPVKYIGVGEGIEDLQEFDANTFVEALFE